MAIVLPLRVQPHANNMPLLTTIAELQAVTSVENTLDPETFAPYVIQVEREYLRDVLGDTFMATLQTEYDGTLSADNELLLPYIHRVLGPLAVYHMIPNTSVRISNSGVQVTSSNDFVSASGQEIYYVRKEIRDMGLNALDSLYDYLESKKDTYTVWAGSTAYTRFKKYFISSAAQFQSYGVDISSSRLIFGKLIPTMAIMEQRYIVQTITRPLFMDLKTKWAADNISPEEQILLDYLCMAIALYTYSMALMDRNLVDEINTVNATRSENFKKNKEDFADFSGLCKQYNDLAEASLGDAVGYLNDTASGSVFPLWFNSKLYVNPTTPKSSSDYRNRDSEGSFMAL
ncbi:MAG: hypothetical protein JWO03_2879 [Bacteroidetes bacterium]|nr:hypothetical protein [Bacteroidota bacterium]